MSASRSTPASASPGSLPTASPTIVALGVLDGERLAGSGGVAVRWAELGVPAPGNARTFRAVFGRADETFRRLDATSRALVLAAEAAGVAAMLARIAHAGVHGAADTAGTTAANGTTGTNGPREPNGSGEPSGVGGVTARDVGLVFETTLGSLDSDLTFAASLGAGMPDGPAFAYTLPSTCLGELALRHGLRGPTVCLTTVVAERGVALREAALLLATGEVSLVVAGLVDVLATAHGGVAAECRAVVALLAAPALGLPPVARWPGTERDAYDRLVASLPPAAR